MRPAPRTAPEPVAQTASTARTYTRAEAADLLSITSRSLRRYLSEFGEFFGDRDTLDDVAIARLRMIRDMKAEGKHHGQIKAGLAMLSDAAEDDALADSATYHASIAIPGAQSKVDVLSAIAAVQAGVARLERAVEKILGRLHAIELSLFRS